MSTKKLTYMGLLTSVSLIIFMIELRLPELTPIPGMKLGLANIITVYAVYSLTGGETAMILTARILLGAIFGGNASTLIFSLSGGMLCLIGMLALRKIIDRKYLWLCSIFGAIFHNLGQIGAAVIVMKTTAVIGYLPFLMVSGCIAGLFTGITAQLLIKRGPPGEGISPTRKL